MTSQFSAQVNFGLMLRELATAVAGDQPNWQTSFGSQVDFSDGVGSSQFDLLYAGERTVLTGATDSIDLAGVLASALGKSFAAVELALIALLNKQKDGTANTTALTVGGGSNKLVGMFDSMVIQPGNFILAGGGHASGLCVVTPATGDLLQIINAAGATNKYMLALLGRAS